MILIFVLMLVACAGSIYAAYVMKKERESRVRNLITALEQGDAATLPQAADMVPKGLMESVEQRLLWAGRPSGLTGQQFLALKVAGLVALPILTPFLFVFQLGALTLPLMILAGVVGFLLPDVWLNGKVSQRKQQVAEELPLFADLVATAVSAGLPLTEAVRRVAADVPGLVAREFLRAVQEMAAGKPRGQAWRDIVERVPGDELRAIVGAIMQAEQYGTSVAELIRYQVQQIRLLKQQEAQRIAQATTVKMRIPMHRLEAQPYGGGTV